MITPTCQVCGTMLNLEDGSSIEAAIRRGASNVDPDDEDYWAWNQDLRFRFCGGEHMKSWMSTYALPAYVPPSRSGDNTIASIFEGLGVAAVVGLLLVILTGAVFGFLLLIERVF